MKVFRKVRSSLLAKNKKGKYLQYALGEIVLVVIGILVAIQLNDLGLQNSNNNQKKVVLSALQLEFEANLRQLDTVIFYNKEVPKAYFVGNSMIKNQHKNYTTAQYNDLILGLGWTYTFNPSNGALRSAISSSEIHLIKNKRLIEILFSWEDVIKDSDEEALTIRKFQYESLVMKANYISAIGEWKAIFPEMLSPKTPSNFKGLLQDKAFENYSIRSCAYAKEYLSELNDIKNQNQEILLLINQELKK